MTGTYLCDEFLSCAHHWGRRTGQDSASNVGSQQSLPSLPEPEFRLCASVCVFTSYHLPRLASSHAPCCINIYTPGIFLQLLLWSL
ncbi:rCG61908, isoform CRA_c [Rattus norvegicus]|uniref:RCG61908, isoform CRA_c n=1 Tax=Rattus norvegicus TaxID=10116 RepID=A6HCI2_RAT|nr:rCG61908, isoform CRA_c [Rattus norvegicus]